MQTAVVVELFGIIFEEENGDRLVEFATKAVSAVMHVFTRSWKARQDP
jgi:hypothetical protein